MRTFLTRRRGQRKFSALPRRVRLRLALACHELNEAEEEMASWLGLGEPPRLLMVDEEEATVVFPDDRADL